MFRCQMFTPLPTMQHELHHDFSHHLHHHRSPLDHELPNNPVANIAFGNSCPFGITSKQASIAHLVNSDNHHLFLRFLCSVVIQSTHQHQQQQQRVRNRKTTKTDHVKNTNNASAC